ncbi:MAG: DNA topoisomerase III [Clostridia bacterium]|nr:DNA topoisomerase III [Clostridia bacterium]
MGKIVVVAEKPSVGRDIARVIGCRERGDGCLMGEKYIVTWAVGHLVTLVEPDELDEKYKKWSFATLPILPAEIPLKVIRGTSKQFQIIKKLINAPDTDSLICATDAGREGELIFRYIYEKAGCRKPFDRLWISSMTDEAISEGFRSIQPGRNYDGLYASARCRSKADWLVGMNASRAFTLKYDALLSVGRVQTPTLAILVKRRKEIENFQPEAYCTLQADFGDYSGTCFSDRWEPDTHIPRKEEADAIAAAVKGREAEVIRAETTRKTEPPPQLYDLTSLQRDANKMLGFTADKTLKTAQSLYETHKALTYPRTDSRYLPPDMIPRVVQTMKMLPESYQRFVPGALRDGKLPVSRRTIDASKVTDHHAIIPTNKRVDPGKFSADEQKLYDLVARRTLAAFYPACEYDATRVITRAEGHDFRTNGKVIVVNGWHDVPPLAEAAGKPAARTRKKKDDEEESVQLPPLQPGDRRTVKDTKVKEDKTKPPAPHTDASLLLAMETAGKELEDEELSRQMKGSGIGTPATRAAIIERLLQVGYAQRKGKTLLATDKGVRLIEIMPEELASPELTGRWELALHEITDGKQDADRFLEGINRMCVFLVDYARDRAAQVTFPEEDRGRGKGGKRGYSAKVLEGTVCPVCGKGKLRESGLAFECTEKGCKCTIWKDMLTRGGGPQLNEKLLRLILEKRQVKGSTGTIQLQEGWIRFYPNGSETPSVSRPLIYEKKK